MSSAVSGCTIKLTLQCLGQHAHASGCLAHACRDSVHKTSAGGLAGLVGLAGKQQEKIPVRKLIRHAALRVWSLCMQPITFEPPYCLCACSEPIQNSEPSVSANAKQPWPTQHLQPMTCNTPSETLTWQTTHTPGSRPPCPTTSQ